MSGARAHEPVGAARTHSGIRQRLQYSPPTVCNVAAVDDYFETLDADTRATFEHIRGLVLDIAPEAEQGTSYGMAALKYKQKPLLGFAAAKRHLSIFPFSSRVVEEVRDQLTGFELSKGTIRFTAARPLPDDVVRDVVMLRVAEIVGSTG
jgi:uncharacterized protein YdhG (YjbR/CyaY superfamily)